MNQGPWSKSLHYEAGTDGFAIAPAAV
ncbi:MAG: hypothetical protein JWP25_7147, partial [Bradyrhizobium sp.]|nr:hypothetical protein [Bradyrhizobium sp.]